jgi:hypothetical protein
MYSTPEHQRKRLRLLLAGQVSNFMCVTEVTGVSKPIIGEMAKRIWWSMYALEVESSLNCGRPSIYFSSGA